MTSRNKKNAPAVQADSQTTDRPVQKGLREAQKRFTRERLLDAAYEVFQETGFRSATIDSIATRAGANRATFYLHFKDKLDLAAGLARRIIKLSVRHFAVIDTMPAPSPSDIKLWLEGYFADRDQDPVLAQILGEVISSDRHFAEEYLEYLGRLADSMTRYLGRFSGKQREIARSKIILMQMLIGRYHSYSFAQSLEFPGKFPAQALAEIVWNTLYSDSPPTVHDKTTQTQGRTSSVGTSKARK